MGALHPGGLCLMAFPWGLGWRKLPHTWAPDTRTWLWREVVRVGLKEAEKLLKVMGNMTSTLDLSCTVPRGRA